MHPALLPLVLTLLCATAASSAGQEDGARAAPGRWTVRGGNLARSAAALTPALRERPVPVWSVELEGTLEDEPLVWDQRVLLVERLAGEARLRGFDLTTGREIVQPYPVRTPHGLETSLWGARLVVRSDTARVLLLGWERGASRMQVLRSTGYEHAVVGALLFADELYVATRGGVERRRAGGARTQWETELAVAGPLCLRGSSIFVPVQAGTSLGVAELDRASGALLSRKAVGVPLADHCVELAVLPGAVLVHGVPLRGTRPGTVESAMLPRPFPHPELHVGLPGGTLHAHGLAEHGNGWINHLIDDGYAGAQLVWNEDASNSAVRILANGAVHAELLEHPVPPTVSGDVLLLAGCAVDLATQRILWKREPVQRRSVPARGTLLVVEGERRVVALRPEAAVKSAAVVLAPAGAFAGRALFSDGFVLEGEFELRADTGELVPRGAGHVDESHSLESLLWVESEAGALHYLASPEDLARGVELWIEDDLARGYTELAREARKSRDSDLLERLLTRALEHGGDGERLESVIETLEELRERPRRRSERAVEDVLAAEQRLRALPLERLWRRFRELPAAAGGRIELELLRALLTLDPTHAGAAAALRARVPKGFVVPPGAPSVDWIDLVQAASECPVRLVAMPSPETVPQGDGGRALARAREGWRPDLVALESEHLLIVTSLAEPGAVARCLSFGELVCSALGEIFVAGTARRAELKLVLHLFESKDEYLRHSPGGEGDAGLAWTAGHYDPLDNVSRIYLPAGDEALESVLQTYAHELTHHWLQVQCPLYTYEEARQRSDDAPGFWIVEGFAALVEEFVFDTARRRWDSFNPAARRIDLVAHAGEAQLLPWEALYSASKRGFLEAELSDVRPIPTGWRVGLVEHHSGRNVFYAQAATTCHYLFHAEDGDMRDELLEYLRRHYTGQRSALAVEEAFGLAPAELGRRVHAWARAVGR